MSTPSCNVKLYTNTGRQITALENAFISEYVHCKNATQAAYNAGYKAKDMAQQGRRLLDREYISEEISYRLKAMESARIASATEVLQFYTSVMRGEILDQFGIEASLDTRIKAANELAKHQIELPMKLESKQNSNQIGSIQLNFLPRPSENKEES